MEAVASPAFPFCCGHLLLPLKQWMGSRTRHQQHFEGFVDSEPEATSTKFIKSFGIHSVCEEWCGQTLL